MGVHPLPPEWQAVFDASTTVDAYPYILWDEGYDKIKTILEHHQVTRTTVYFIVDDYEGIFPQYSYQHLLRTSARASQIRLHESILPYGWECADRPFEPLPQMSPRPIVGFCGMMNSHRRGILNMLHKCPYIDTRFIINQRFWGGAPHDPNLVDTFNKNIQHSHFVVCNRGAGNFSMRFYQTMAYGRIPVLINSDIRFPLHDTLDYHSCIVIGATEEATLERLWEVWCNDDIVERQRRCARLFHKYLRLDRFVQAALSEIQTQD